MEKIIAGVHKFRSTEYVRHRDLFEQLAAKKQQPKALFITCSDSRVDPNLITQTDPGDLFLIRNAGNIVPPHHTSSGGEAATVEFSVEVIGIRNIIICGHSQCGAMEALLLHPDEMEHLPAVRAWCGHAEATRRIVQKKYRGLSPEELAVAATEENVLVQMNNLTTHPSVAARLASGELHVYGWYYDIGSGKIYQYEQRQGRFAQLDGEAYAAQPLPIRAGAATVPAV